MEKINFENKPSTNTPINATNLNTLQNNIENAINEYLPITLFENESGLTGNITLNDNVSNYSFIEIIYGCDGYYFYSKFENANGKKVGFITPYVSTDNGNLFLYTSNYEIFGNEINFLTCSNVYVNTSNTIGDYGNNSYIRIYKVFGYK